MLMKLGGGRKFGLKKCGSADSYLAFQDTVSERDKRAQWRRLVIPATRESCKDQLFWDKNV